MYVAGDEDNAEQVSDGEGMGGVPEAHEKVMDETMEPLDLLVGFLENESSHICMFPWIRWSDIAPELF
jgi:hypothetical protein